MQYYEYDKVDIRPSDIFQYVARIRNVFYITDLYSARLAFLLLFFNYFFGKFL